MAKVVVDCYGLSHHKVHKKSSRDAGSDPKVGPKLGFPINPYLLGIYGMLSLFEGIDMDSLGLQVGSNSRGWMLQASCRESRA